MVIHNYWFTIYGIEPFKVPMNESMLLWCDTDMGTMVDSLKMCCKQISLLLDEKAFIGISLESNSTAIM